jgi:hypothetical protein
MDLQERHVVIDADCKKYKFFKVNTYSKFVSYPGRRALHTSAGRGCTIAHTGMRRIAKLFLKTNCKIITLFNKKYAL